MSQNTSKKLVSASALREFTRGSYEHLTIRLEDALKQSRSMFVENTDAAVGILATFNDHVVVGTGDGKYFYARYEERDNGIRFDNPQQLDVPVVDADKPDYARQMALGAVDALLAGKKNEALSSIASLLTIHESVGTAKQDLDDIIVGLLGADTQWRALFQEQAVGIRNELGQKWEDIVGHRVPTKFNGLYDGTIAEEEFPNYADEVTSDLRLMADMYEGIYHKTESSYYPFIEEVSKAKLTRADENVIVSFASLAEDYLNSMRGIQEHVAYAQKNERCIMCLARVHDALAEAITDYELVGAFVEHMTKRYNEAV